MTENRNIVNSVSNIRISNFELVCSLPFALYYLPQLVVYKVQQPAESWQPAF